jgi:hypothetical protein
VELDRSTASGRGYTLAIQNAFRQIDTLIRALMSEDTRSAVSSNRSSKNSSTNSSVASKMKAKAEAARVRVRFAEKESELKKQGALLEQQYTMEAAVATAKAERHRTDINADLEVLVCRKEAAAAEAEAEVLIAAEGSSSGELYTLAQPIDSAARTKAYIEKQASDIASDLISNQHTAGVVTQQTMNPCASTFYSIPNRIQDTNQCLLPEVRPPAEQRVATDLTRFLLKKDLLLSRLVRFNDKPESYATWKISFREIMADLSVNPSGETDLLLKWSGPESQRHVQSIKTANARSPEKGLERIWERLDERYGAPEMILASMRQRLESFFKLTTKDTKKLYELSDLVFKIESIKVDDKYRSLLGHYESSTGVSPIVSKLPFNLQERWTSSAVRYIKAHDVTYPPFGHFAEFLREQIRTRNNPSFVYEISSVGLKKEKTSSWNPDINHVHSRKTDTKDTERANGSKVKTESNRCPLHNTNHSLNKCKGFKAKPIDERRNFIRENNICFRCCESTSHLKRVCKADIRCSDCGRDKHASAVHYDGYVPSLPRNRSSENGGETGVKSVYTDTVNSSCTQICGNGFAGKSCAKTLLVNVCRKDDIDRSVRIYAMVDDQSNRSLASPKLFNMLGIAGQTTEYTLSLCAGRFNVSGRRTSDLLLESLDGATKLELPTVIECKQIPDCRDDIPTPEVALCYPHL